jgi:hypothetical protein
MRTGGSLVVERMLAVVDIMRSAWWKTNTRMIRANYEVDFADTTLLLGLHDGAMQARSRFTTHGGRAIRRRGGQLSGAINF